MINNQMQLLMQVLSSGNPQQMVQQMVQQNPQMNAIINQAKQSGMPIKDYVLNYAKQNNIDINPMLNALKQRGYRF